MTKQTNLVPKRRFKEFQNTHAWEYRKLDELAEVRTGKAFSSADFKDDGEYLVVTNKNIQDEANSVTSVGDRIDISEDTILNNYLLSGENILVTMDGVNIGKTGKYSNEKAVLAQRVGRLNSKQLEFVYQITSSNKFVSEMNKLSVGNAIKHISLKQISDYLFSAPISEEEQEVIGEFFKQLDKVIAFYQRKLEKTKALKSAYLSEMFPAEGECEPKRRFAGFTQAWEQRKVMDFSEETFGGGTPKTSIKEYWNGEIPWIQSSDLDEHQVSGVFAKKKINEKGLQNSATKLIPKNSIAIVTRVGVGKIALMQFEYATSQDFLSLSNLKVNEWFGVYSLYNQLQKELHNVQGTSIKGITKNELLDKKINIPTNLEEQNKIGEFFKKLDDTIALHQRKLAKLQNIKKAYLNEMFV